MGDMSETQERQRGSKRAEKQLAASDVLEKHGSNVSWDNRIALVQPRPRENKKNDLLKPNQKDTRFKKIKSFV